MKNKPTYADLKESLQEAEEILDTLRSHKVDAVVGMDQVAMMRLKEVEDQLHEQIQISGNRLKEIEAIYQNVPVGLCILDRDLKFIRVNEHLVKIHGVSAEEHLGKTMSEVLPDLAKNIEADLRQVMDSGEAKFNVELCGETPDQPGVERCFLEHWLPLYNKQENLIGLNMVVEEITERKQFEEELQQLNATLEERVAERTKIAEERAEKLREMALQMSQVEEKERQRLARVLHDGLQQLLIGAKFNTKHIKNQLVDQDEITGQLKELDEILDQSIEASRSLSYELSPPILHDQGLLAALHWLTEIPHMKGLSIEIQADKKIPPLSQNLKVFLFQVVREFLINIIKHAKVDKAKVRVSSDKENICVEVIDKGAGFDVEKEKLSSSTSQGLRNIREKLDLMNGHLNIDSLPGEGSHFTMSIPLEKHTPSNPAQVSRKKKVQTQKITSSSSDSAGSSSNAIKLLVVDDHQLMRNGLVRLLASEPDFSIIGEAGNGVEAIDFVHKYQPDVIIMDITMPEMDGIEATRQIHQKFPDIQIVGLSMHEEGEYSTQIKKAGAKYLLNKGGPSEQLFAAIRS
ncbi:MAG: response regulator [Balneolaceae bacterium]